MKKAMTKWILSTLPILLTLVSCNNQVNQHVDVCEIKIDTIVYLDSCIESSPKCSFKCEYKYLKSGNSKDSVLISINNVIQNLISDNRESGLESNLFLEKLSDTYLRNYIKEVKPLYLTDIENKVNKEDLPAWYDHEFEIRTDINEGKDGYYNYSVEEYQYTGGAHPNTTSRMVNINSKDGSILKIEDLFKKGSEEDICGVIMKYLIEKVNEKLDSETVTDIEGLREIGLLLDNDLYIPENFLYGKNVFTFYYNRYEIGPYSVGDFVIEIPYYELEKYLK